MAPLLDAFQRIYVINLASRTDRRREMEAQFQRIGLSLHAPGVELFEAVRPDDAGEFPSIGSRGCFLSHLGVLKKASASGLQRILIVEDDLNFSDDFLERIGPITKQLQSSDWSIFYGGYRLDEQGALAFAGHLLPIPAEEGVGTTHFLGIAGEAIELLVAYLEAQLQRPSGDPRGGPMHVDGSYTWFRRAHPHLVTLLAVPELGHQRASRTDIHDLRWHDRVWGLRSAAAFFRKLRNR